jgi:Na+-translocating ferredoxin:NAD+ oxidoreductase RnfD subunit
MATEVRPSQVVRYFLTPKGLLFLLLLALTAVAYPVDGRAALLRIGLSASVAVASELLLTWRQNSWKLPDGALLTGLIVAMVMSQTAPWYAPVFASALAIASKHLIRGRLGHVFNPAAVGLLLTGLLFSSEQSWWGGLGDLPAPFIVLVIAAGLLVVERVNKLPSVLAFLAVYFGLLTAASIAGNPLAVADTFREPMLGAAMYFAFFMLSDPPTSPARASDQVWFAAAVAVISLLCLALTSSAVYYLLVGLLGGNALEAARRGLKSRLKRKARATGPRLSSSLTPLT